MSADIGQAVRDRFAHTASIEALVGDRIFADVLMQGCELPALVVQVPDQSTVEFVNSATRYPRATVTIQAYGGDREQAGALAKLVRDEALPADLRGVVEGIAIGEVSLIGGPADLIDEPKDGSDKSRRLTQQTFSIWYQPI